MSKGCGFCPCGTAPAGWGTPDLGLVNVPSPLPDPLTKVPLTGRFIDYTTGDYEFSADGRIAGMSTVQQLVLLALLNGNIFAGIAVKLPNYQRTIANRVQTALNPIIQKGWLELVTVSVVDPDTSPDASGILVKWRDLTLTAPGANPTNSQTVFSTAIPVT